MQHIHVLLKKLSSTPMVFHTVGGTPLGGVKECVCGGGGTAQVGKGKKSASLVVGCRGKETWTGSASGLLHLWKPGTA